MPEMTLKFDGSQFLVAWSSTMVCYITSSSLYMSAQVQWFFLWQIFAILSKIFCKKFPFKKICKTISSFCQNRHNCLQYERVLKIFYFDIAKFGKYIIDDSLLSTITKLKENQCSCYFKFNFKIDWIFLNETIFMSKKMVSSCLI
jgi:hypothetical protein